MADPAHDQYDDGFHEIHLTGKQVVFLCMATTVISVVIFLCGVAVGRSVQGGGLDPTVGVMAANAAPDDDEEVLPSPEPIVEREPGPPMESDTGYVQRLTEEQPGRRLPRREDPPAETRSESGAEREPEPEPRPVSEPPAKPAPEPTKSDLTDGARPGTWAVQVISLQNREAAERVVRRLRTKSYPAYLVEPAPGAPSQLYKVQVGRFADRAEAVKVEARLKKEEQFDTWIVR